MAFKKQGIAPIANVYCSCGGEIQNGKCVKCGKDHMIDNAEGSDESKEKKEKPNG